MLTDRLLFNLSSVPYLECEEPRRRVPDDIEYGGLAIYRISYLWLVNDTFYLKENLISLKLSYLLQ